MELYAPGHPLVQRGMDAFTAAATEGLQSAPSIVIAFIGDAVVVDAVRLPKGAASLVGFVRDLREQDVEKITLTRGLSKEEVRAFVAALTDRKSPMPVNERIVAR